MEKHATAEFWVSWSITTFAWNYTVSWQLQIIIF